MIIGILQVTAAVGYSQTARLTIDMQEATVAQVIAQIENESQFYFTYNTREINPNRIVSIQVNETDINTLLNQLFADEPVNYIVVDKHVVLYKEGKIAYTGSAQQGIVITGVISDADGEPLPGATAKIKGGTQGAVTDANGVYSLSVPDENTTLIFSYIGYAHQEILVGNQRTINIILIEDAREIEEVVVVGYGTTRKRDLTGSLTRVKTEELKTRSMSQLTEMLSGSVAGLNSTQSTGAAGGASMEMRGPTSITATSSPLIVLDGAVFYGSIREINPMDIVSIDVLKDASSAAVFGSNAASGVILITTNKGELGKKPVISFTGKIGMAEDYKQRRGLGAEDYLQFRSDWLSTLNPNTNKYYYTHPDQLGGNMTLDEWFALSNNPQADKVNEYMTRISLYPEERKNYIAGETMDIYDHVFRKGMRQDYDLSIAGGSSNATYYWSIGYNDYEGIRVGDQYSTIRTRLNVDFTVTDWLNAGVNAHFSDRDESSVPASMGFYSISPYGEMFDEDGNLKRLPHGHTDNPLLDYYRTDRLDKTNSLFANIFADVKLPFGFKYRLSFQPNYRARKYYDFVNISKELGGLDTEVASGERREYSYLNWMLDHLLTWKMEAGYHRFDATFLANAEDNRSWQSTQTNKNFFPSQLLGYHGLHYGDGAGINSNDTRSTGAAYMARLNYSFMGKYLFNASIRRDGFSAFGTENPWATFPAVGIGWMISEEGFFKVDAVDRLKLRASWGVNGNRNIGIYDALADTEAKLWYDGSNTRVGVYTVSLANSGLRWERTKSLNFGVDLSLLKNRIDFVFDVYSMTTNDLLLSRQLPSVTGFSTVMSNLGELQNRGFDLTLNTVNIKQPEISWTSSLVFSMNRNKINRLFGDQGTYTLLNKESAGELPDFTNRWFPGQSLNDVWDYKIVGIWQTSDETEAAKYGLRPGDYKAEDVNGDGKYTDLQDKKFIGNTIPRYRLGFQNDVRFLKNFTASVFLRAELGHLRQYSDALNYDVQGAWRNRSVGPVPYWMPDRPHNEYPRLDARSAQFGGGIRIFKSTSFLRIQDISLAYDMPAEIAHRMKLNNCQVFCSIRNLLTFTKWPGWDPESNMAAMPRIYTFGINFSL
jgi:TonB-linked SusC/RagA family outer membrane protein